MITFGTLCTGIGGFDLGFEPGMECKWMVEIDKSCQTILRKRFPKAKLYDDITKEGSERLERVNVLAGGTPCTGFSIDGLRKGSSDERSNLCFQFCRIADELNPDVLIWENVPGCLSMPDNSFGSFIAAIVGFDAPLVHPDTRNFKAWWTDGKLGIVEHRYPVWPSAGMVIGPKRVAAWRILDSQYFNLAQRRERVFVVADTLGGRSVEILFECEMLRRNSPPSRETGQDVAATLGASPEGSGPRTDYERMTLLPTHEISPCLQERGAKGADSDITQAHVIVPSATGFDRTTAETTGEISSTLRACSAKTKGTNNGKADTQCVAFQPRYFTRDNKTGGAPNEHVTNPLTSNPKKGDSENCVAFRAAGQDGFTPSEISPPIASTDGGGAGVPTVFQCQGSNTGEMGTLKGTDNVQSGVPFTIQNGYKVRRLVPVETERLQGFPDSWTLIGLDPNGKERHQKDSPRYRQIGNAVSVPVARWIGDRIVKFGFKR